MPDRRDSLLDHIMREIEIKRGELAKLEQLYESAGGTLDSRRRKYLGMRVWRATYEYLTGMPEYKAAAHDILDELLSAQVPMGTYPKRTLAASLTSKWVSDLFQIERVGSDDVISLKRVLTPEERNRQRSYPRVS